MATRKKAQKRSKTAAKRKTATKSKRAKSATAKSKPKSTKRTASKKRTAAKSAKAGKPGAKAAKRSTAAKAKATKKKSARSASEGEKKEKTRSGRASVSASSATKKSRRGRGSNSLPRISKTKSAPPPPPEEKPIRKTRLNEKQLAEFKNRLLEKRRMLTGDVRNLTLDALRRDSTGDLSNMPIHMADIGSDNWEQEFTIGLIENEQQLVREIDAALARIVDRTYGVCLATGKHIGVARLRAKPWAKYCIEYARKQETGHR